MNKLIRSVSLIFFLTIIVNENLVFAGQWIQTGKETRVAKSKEEIAGMIASTESLNYLKSAYISQMLAGLKPKRVIALQITTTTFHYIGKTECESVDPRLSYRIEHTSGEMSDGTAWGNISTLPALSDEDPCGNVEE